MQKAPTIGIVDIGNTAIKVAVFKGDQLISKSVFYSQNEDRLTDFILKKTDVRAISSVRNNQETDSIISDWSNTILISPESSIPFLNQYESKTLGMDRLCNASFLSSHTETEIGICIDIGTCIKFDVFQRKVGYLGGSISPGIHLRYKSLNDYTGKLPLLSNTEKIQLLGTSTQSSIHSGVINGIQGEVEAFIQRYEAQYSSLTFFVTGGDASNFDFQTKNNIFADENLTLKGLYEIYKHNT